jgi:hypothetical protein
MSRRKLAGVKNLSRSRRAPREFLAVPGSNPLLPENPVIRGIRLGRAKYCKGQSRNKKRYYPFHTYYIGKKKKNS